MNQSPSRISAKRLSIAGLVALSLAACSASGRAPVICPGSSAIPTARRPVATSCPSGRGAGDKFDPRAGDECTSDAMCTARPNGRCLFDASRGNGLCSYDGCTTDADCAGNQVCHCRLSETSNQPNICLPGNCRIDADRGSSGACSLSWVPGARPPWEGDGGPGFTTAFSTGYFCHTSADCCSNNSDCTPNGSHYDYCLFSTNKWTCGGGP